MVDVRRTQLNFTNPGRTSHFNPTYAARPGQTYVPGPRQTYVPGPIQPDVNSYQQNQLLFNLNVASNPTNIAARFKQPGPLVIEKLGGSGVREDDATSKVSPLKFSAVSEDRLSVAIQLARRDLKNKLREEEQQKRLEEIEAAEAKNHPKGKKKVKKGQNKVTNVRQGKILGSRRLPVRERGDRQNVRTVQTQTPPKKSVLHVKQAKSGAPGLLILPQTPPEDRNSRDVRRRKRDASQTPPSKEVRISESPTSRQTREIKRLRQELKDYIEKIEQLSKQASQNTTLNKKSKPDPDETEEEAQRKAVRQAEQASRSARLLYSLQQQVREIQEELDKLGPGQIRHTKKSRAVNRLAAAHRGAVRALQTFVHHLPEGVDANSGFPPLYQELALLIRQLSMCCAQLEIGDSSGVPDGVLSILEQAKGLENALEQQLQSPSRPARRTNQESSPRRRLAFEQRSSTGGQQTPSQSTPNRVTFRDDGLFETSPSKDLPVRDTDPYRPALAPQERQGQAFSLPIATPGSPERNEVLRAGLRALLRAGGNKAGIPQGTARMGREPAKYSAPGSQPIRTQNRRPIANRKPARRQQGPTGKSLLLPAKLKADRERIQRNKVSIKDAHFTLGTKSSIAKQQAVRPPTQADVEGRSETPPPEPKPAWTPPGSPRSFHKVTSTPRKADEDTDEEDDIPSLKSPRSPRSPRSKGQSPRWRGHGSRVHFKADERMGGIDDDMAEREIARQAWLDSEVSRRLAELDELRNKELVELQKLREDLEQPSHWIENAEQAIRERLQPIISEAEELSSHHRRRTHMDSQSVSRQLSKRAIDKATHQADILSDLILDDILEDTVKEMERMEHRADIDQQVKQMQDAPTIEGLIQTLDIMEAEEESIRRRWKKVSYTDSATYVAGSHLPQNQTNAEDGIRDDWMTGTPLEGALLERLSGDVPSQHTSVTFTNKPASRSKQVNPYIKDSHLSHSHTGNQQKTEDHAIHLGASREIGEEYLHDTDIREDYFHIENSTKESHLLAKDNQSNTNYTSQNFASSLEKPKIVLFIPTESKKRIDQYRGRFDRHLKRKSHQTIGTFDPWSLCNEVADEIVDDLIEQVTNQVGHIMSSCVEDIYEKEFDMNS